MCLTSILSEQVKMLEPRVLNQVHISPGRTQGVYQLSIASQKMPELSFKQQ